MVVGEIGLGVGESGRRFFFVVDRDCLWVVCTVVPLQSRS